MGSSLFFGGVSEPRAACSSILAVLRLLLRSGEEMLVTRRDVAQRPVRGESSEADSGLAAQRGGGQAGQGAKLQVERSETFVARSKHMSVTLWFSASSSFLAWSIRTLVTNSCGVSPNV